MELQFKGANCIKINIKGATAVVDDNLDAVGLKSIVNKADIALYTADHLNSGKNGDAFVLDTPGEYEIKGLSVYAIPARAHMDEEGKETATILKVVHAGVSIVFAGHIYPDLSDEQLERIGMIDVLVVPVGGSGYTLDAEGAAKVVKKIEPKIVIPTHYAAKGVKYEVPQNELDPFLKELGKEAERLDKLKLKDSSIPEDLVVYQLEQV